MSGADVLRVHEVAWCELATLCGRYGFRLECVAAGASIPGSYWGEPEAGISGDVLFVRPDTPLHSLLHELSHLVCMTPRRRADVHRDAGGTVAEECAVCYLELQLAAQLPGFGLERCLADMDRWGYSFREGSAANWLAGDAADARCWLLQHGLLAADGELTWAVRRQSGTAG